MKILAWLLFLSCVYATVLALITVLNWVGADRFWLGALNFYLPQAMWALPGILLAVCFLKIDRFWLWLPILCIAWVLGPIMDFHWSPESGGAAAYPADPVRLRVMTWNIKYGQYDLEPLLSDLERYNPDVVFFQDAGGALAGPLRGYFRDWQVRSHGQYVIASRYPLSPAEAFPMPGYGQEYLTCRLTAGGRQVTLYNVHFKTPRWSLNAFRAARHQPWYLPRAIETFLHNINTRLSQAETVGISLSGADGPVIVAGDLNSPDGSRVVATLRDAGLSDAFVEAGRGYGFTYGHFLLKYRIPWLKLSWMRIDHVMVNRAFRTERCWTGTGKASDHRPVLADLVLQNPESGR